jgi:DNA polymerase beta
MDFKAIIVKELDTMRKADLARKKIFEARAYAKAISEISALERPITSLDDVKDLPGVGKKIKEKVSEIISTGSLQSAARARAEVSLDIMDALQSIHGIGPVKAKELIEVNKIKTIEDLHAALKTDPTILNDVQKMGLKYYEDAILRIPRSEMVEHEEMILAALDERFKAQVVGSYRRGAADSGDIDVLLTLPDDMNEKDQGKIFLDTVKLLKDVGYIIDTLAQGPKKFLGYVRLDKQNKARRLDLLMTPESEFAYAILYFTGSQNFNMAFRKYALKQGYTLNEHTMKPTKGHEDLKAPPPMKSEADIFAFLNLKYIEPTKRQGEKDIILLTSNRSRSRSRSRGRK